MNGPERRVLVATRDLPKDEQGFVHATEIAKKTGLSQRDVVASLQALAEEGYAEFVRLQDERYTAYITPKGRLWLSQNSLAQPDEPEDDSTPAKAILRGLLPFEDGDTLIGRKSEVQDLVTIIQSQDFRFGVVWGRSGCGKTSVLRAGLLPALREARIYPFYLSRPTSDPKEALFAEIGRQLSSTESTPGGPTIEELMTLLAAQGGGYTRGIVIIDQFEEFFLINRTKESQSSFRTWLGQQIRNSSVPQGNRI